MYRFEIQNAPKGMCSGFIKLTSPPAGCPSSFGENEECWATRPVFTDVSKTKRGREKENVISAKGGMKNLRAAG